MAFNDELKHKLLFDTVKDIYEYFNGWEEYNPTVCDPNDRERVREISDRLGHKFQSIIQDLDDLHTINVDSYGC